MENGERRVLIEIGGAGSSLRVEVERQATPSAIDEPWFDTTITVDAYPFSGSLRTIFTLGDLREWGQSLTAALDGAGQVLLGGDRAAALLIVAEPQEGGDNGAVAMSVTVTPSGDDPFPSLTYLIFDVPSSWTQIGTALSALD